MGELLVVEDDDDLRSMLAVWLKSEGYDVIEAVHGQDALDKLQENLRRRGRPCLILLDLFMPTMNGWAFREAQMKDAALADIPVVVVSADPDAARHAATLGVAAAMTKPIDFERLLNVVGQYC